MNREIKFRFWNRIAHRFQPPSKYAIDGEGSIIAYDYETGLYEEPTKPSNSILSIQQYAGLKDKNGKEIYEGDILLESLSYEDSQGGQISPDIDSVNFKYGCFYWGNVALNEYVENICFISQKTPYSEYLEVIGNIFENPELLNTNNEQDVVQKLKSIPSLECSADPNVTVEDLKKALAESCAAEHQQLIDSMGKEWVDKNKNI